MTVLYVLQRLHWVGSSLMVNNGMMKIPKFEKSSLKTLNTVFRLLLQGDFSAYPRARIHGLIAVAQFKIQTLFAGGQGATGADALAFADFTANTDTDAA